MVTANPLLGMRGGRRTVGWIAALVHRISGLLLLLFLPLHFLVLGLAIKGEARLEAQIRWTHDPLVRIAEAGLVLAFAVHLLGGIRLLLIEHFGLSRGHRSVAVAAFLVAIATGAIYYLRAA
jgi:fumarate reductase subunit D